MSARASVFDDVLGVRLEGASLCKLEHSWSMNNIETIGCADQLINHFLLGGGGMMQS